MTKETIRVMCLYAAYGLKWDKNTGRELVDAMEQKRQPGLVRVRTKHGSLENFGMDLAVTAICNGGALEE